jgi:hypothetical protein
MPRSEQNMKRYECDYLEGAAEQVPRAGGDQREQTVLRRDDYCDLARPRIAALCEMPGAGIHFSWAPQVNLTGGSPPRCAPSMAC